MVITHNISAVNSKRQLGIVTGSLSSSAEKLSSGYQINRAADDAAGLSISEKMRKQVRGLSKAVENAEDGISFCQVADGGLAETTDMVQRMRELAVQAANETNSGNDRASIQAEIDQLVTEIDRVAETTKFNEIYMFSPDQNAFVGKSKNSNIGYRDSSIMYTNTIIHNMVSRNAGEGIIISPVIGSGVRGDEGNGITNILSTEIVPQVVNKFFETFSSFAAVKDTISNEIGLMVYREDSSTMAYVGIQYGLDGTGTISDKIQLSLAVNLKYLKLDTNGKFASDAEGAATRTSLEATIVHEMMHAFMDDTVTSGMIGVSEKKADKENAYPGWFREGMAQAVSGAMNDWAVSIKGKSEADIRAKVKSADNKLGSETTSSKYLTGYLACMYLAYLESGSGTVDGATLADGIDSIMEKLIGGQALSDIINDISGGKYISILDFEEKFGDSASASFIKKLATASGSGAGALISKDLTATDLVANGITTADRYQINATAAYIESNTSKTWTDGGAYSRGVDKNPGDALYNAGSDKYMQVSIQVGNEAGQFMSLKLADMHAEEIGLSGISVLSTSSASAAMRKCDRAIAIVSANRSAIGAYTNRLEHTVRNLDNVIENTQASESKIRDTDMAKEMVSYSGKQILTQAGQAMLAQSNQRNASVLAMIAS